MPKITLGACAACLLLALVPDLLTAQLSYQRPDILSGELWRLWSAHVVHYSLAQAAADAALLLACGALAEPAIGSRRMLCLLLLAAPAISLGLLVLAPSLHEYRGASGLATACAVLAGALLWQLGAWWRIGTAAAVAAFAARTVLEAMSLPLSSATLPDGVTVAWQAHLLGALAGVAAVVLLKPIPPRMKKEYAHGG